MRQGREPWNKGKAMSAETRAKMSRSHTGLKHSPAVRKKMGKAHTGLLHSAVGPCYLDSLQCLCCWTPQNSFSAPRHLVLLPSCTWLFCREDVGPAHGPFAMHGYLEAGSARTALSLQTILQCQLQTLLAHPGQASLQQTAVLKASQAGQPLHEQGHNWVTVLPRATVPVKLKHLIEQLIAR